MYRHLKLILSVCPCSYPRQNKKRLDMVVIIYMFINKLTVEITNKFSWKVILQYFHFITYSLL